MTHTTTTTGTGKIPAQPGPRDVKDAARAGQSIPFEAKWL